MRTQEEYEKVFKNKKLVWVTGTYEKGIVDIALSHIKELKEKYPLVQFYLVYDGRFYYWILADNIYLLFKKIEICESYLKKIPEMTNQIVEKYSKDIKELDESEKRTLVSLSKAKKKIDKKLKEMKNVI